MDKPISIVIEETKGALANVVNTCGLPVSVVKLIFNEVNAEVNAVAIDGLKNDIKQYQSEEKSEEVEDDAN